MNKKSSYPMRIFLAVIGIIGIVLVLMFIRGGEPEQVETLETKPLSTLIAMIQGKQISSIVIQYDDHGIAAAVTTQKNKEEKKTITILPKDHSDFVKDLKNSGIEYQIEYPPRMPIIIQQILGFISTMILPILLFVFFIVLLNNRNSMMMFSKQFKQSDPDNSTLLSDIKGIDMIKDNIMDLVNFLRYPEKFAKINARLPRGILLYGDPGTGKTLIARAIANEAKVPFFFCSGSEFVEMYLGLGAQRVRSLFEQAKRVKGKKCVIFIDEIDAIGRKRGSAQGHQEVETTQNELLVKMDGFEQSFNILIIAATNRPNLLDPALTRPGRFDRKLYVPAPDYVGRAEILWLYLKKVATNPEGFPIGILAGMLAGFTGAFIASMVNAAAILAVKRGSKFVDLEDLYKAFYDEMIGLETGRAIDYENKVITAYHEAGHALLSLLTRDPKNPSANCDKILQVTIVPRGGALGMVVSAPDKDQVSVSQAKLLNRICMALGGRIAELIKSEKDGFGNINITAGASSDAEFATKVAKQMVEELGMGDQGMTVYKRSEEPFISPEIHNRLDANKEKIIKTQFDRGYKLLKDNWNLVEIIANRLLEVGTIYLSEVLSLTNLPSYDQEQMDEIAKENPMSKEYIESLKFFKNTDQNLADLRDDDASTVADTEETSTISSDDESSDSEDDL